jgi:hypothetical protein
MTPLGDLRKGARFLWQVAWLLRHPVTIEEARATLRRRLEHREADFLALAKHAIYEYPPSSYRALLRLAGCEYGDLERLVRRDGVEGALGALLRQGVYLTVDEFKGRRPLVRGGVTVEMTSVGLGNPMSRALVAGQTSGSRGTPAPVPMGLDFIRDLAVNECLNVAARGGLGWVPARWSVPTVPFTLVSAASGMPPVRSFSPIDPASMDRRQGWSLRPLGWAGRLAGVRIPAPEYAPPEDPSLILAWLRQVRRSGSAAYLTAYTSSAVRLCQAAIDAGIDVTGTHILAVGESLTAARLAAMRSAGVEVIANYTSVDAGIIGNGCRSPLAPDEVHLFHDFLAVIQPSRPADTPTFPSDALLVSSLRTSAPLMLLNVSLGDRATMVVRRCDCSLEHLGWVTHLHAVRSFEKLTAAGMTFLDTDVIRILDHVLPARFGGRPTDYQLLEEEGDDGRPILRLLVHPDVGPVDGEIVAETFLTAVGDASSTAKIMVSVWRDARLLRVERRPPLVTASGKILHVHVQRRRGTGPSPG